MPGVRKNLPCRRRRRTDHSQPTRNRQMPPLRHNSLRPQAALAANLARDRYGGSPSVAPARRLAAGRVAPPSLSRTPYGRGSLGPVIFPAVEVTIHLAPGWYDCLVENVEKGTEA